MDVIAVGAVPVLPLDPFALADAAAELRLAGEVVPGSVAQVTASWAGLRSADMTDHTETAIATLSALPDAAQDIADTSRTMAAALTTLAEDLAGESAKITALAYEVATHRASLAGGDEAFWLLVGQSRDEDLRERCARVQARIDATMDTCVRDLRRIGPPTVVGLTANPGAPSVDWVGVDAAVRRDLAFAVLTALADAVDPVAAGRLLAAHPDWAELFTQHPPESEDIAAWWAGLGDGGAGFSTLQVGLLAGAPGIIGALGGVPAAGRVGANRVLAGRRLHAARARLAEVLAERAQLGVAGDELHPEIPGLRQEIAYLEDATTPRQDGSYAVQLYLYDPAHHRIVEMIGTPSPATTATVTYSPGTFTTEQSFYGRGVQAVARWLNEEDPGIVGFVWKDGLYPGAANTGASLDGLREANDVDQALVTGETLARFQHDLTTDPLLAGARRVGIGHSYGLAVITGSEVAGARYDQVESLAGAYMPPGWTPDPGTQYTHQTYTDFLSVAQDLGLVGGGHDPGTDPGFISTTYPRPGDFTARLPPPEPPVVGMAGEPLELALTTELVANHSLIASSHPDNFDVLDRIAGRIAQRE